MIERILSRQLLRGGIGSLFTQGSALLLGFATTVVLARALGANGFGVYSYVFSVLSLAAFPLDYGLPALVIRETAVAGIAQEWKRMRGLKRWANNIILKYSLALTVGVASCIFLFGDRLSPEYRETLVFGLILVPFMMFAKLTGASIRGLRRVVIGQLPDTVLRPGLLAILVIFVVFIWGRDGVNAASAMALHALAAAGAFIIGGYMLRRVTPLEARLTAESETDAKRWLKAVLPLSFLAGTRLIGQHMGVLMLGVFGSAADAGVYRVVAQGGALVTFGVVSVNFVMAPHFAGLHKSGDFAALRKVARMGSKASFFLAAPIALLFAIWGHQILRMAFGTEFLRGYTALLVVAVGQLMGASVGSAPYLLNMTGHELDIAKSIGIAIAVNAALSGALVPLFGVDGAAAAFSLTMLGWSTVLWLLVRRRLGINCFVFGKTLAAVGRGQ